MQIQNMCQLSKTCILQTRNRCRVVRFSIFGRFYWDLAISEVPLKKCAYIYGVERESRNVGR